MDSSIRNQFCINRSCKFFRQVGHANIAIHGRKILRFRCTLCKKTWVERKHNIAFGLRSPPELLVRARELIASKASVRRTAKILNVSPGTIQRWKKRFK